MHMESGGELKMECRHSRQRRSARGPHADAGRRRFGLRTNIHLHLDPQQEGVVPNEAVFLLEEAVARECCPPTEAITCKRVLREGSPILLLCSRGLHTVVDHFKYKLLTGAGCDGGSWEWEGVQGVD